MNKKEILKSALIGAVAVGALKVTDAIMDKLKNPPKFLKDDQIPEMVLLNKGRKLLIEGKTKEACEMVRASYELAESPAASGHGQLTLSCFGLWIIGAFRDEDERPESAAIRRNTTDEVIDFFAESAPEEADWIRKTRDDYNAKH
jgi:hypothetical protein